MFEQMVRWHFVLLAAFLVQPHPQALALRIIILDVHMQRRRDAREGRLLDHLAGACEQRQRNCEAECLSRLGVYD